MERGGREIAHERRVWDWEVTRKAARSSSSSSEESGESSSTSSTCNSSKSSSRISSICSLSLSRILSSSISFTRHQRPLSCAPSRLSSSYQLGKRSGRFLHLSPGPTVWISGSIIRPNTISVSGSITRATCRAPPIGT